MDREVLLLLGGGLVGLASSLITTLVNYQLEGRRLAKQLERKNQLRQQEREREDQLHREQADREKQVYLDTVQRQNSLMKIEMLWRDIQRLDEILVNMTPQEQHRRNEYEQMRHRFTQEREGLMRREGLL